MEPLTGADVGIQLGCDTVTAVMRMMIGGRVLEVHTAALTQRGGKQDVGGKGNPSPTGFKVDSAARQVVVLMLCPFGRKADRKGMALRCDTSGAHSVEQSR